MTRKFPLAIAFCAGGVVTAVVLSTLGALGVGPPASGRTADFSPISLATAQSITCSYPHVLSVNYLNEKVSHELPIQEDNPMIFTFSELDQNVAKLKYIDSTRTISETQVLKISENSDKVAFLEADSENYVTIHTIFKSSGVAIYAKEVSLLGIPAGSLAMGTCVNY